jgi:hypothetical protein
MIRRWGLVFMILERSLPQIRSRPRTETSSPAEKL